MPVTPSLIVAPFIVNTTPTADHPKAVRLSNGNLLVAYIAVVGGGPEYELRGQQFDQAGARIGKQLEFVMARKIIEKTFDITAMPEGRVAIVAKTTSATSGEGDPLFSASLFDVSETETVSVKTTLHGTDVGSVLNAAISRFGINSYKVHYTEGEIGLKGLQEGGFVSGSEVSKGRTLSDTRLRLFPGIRKSTVVSDQLANANIVLVLDRDGDDRKAQLEFRIRDADDRTLRTEDIGSKEAAFHARVVALKQGGFAVVWTEDDGDRDIHYQVFDADGDDVSGFRRVGLDAAGRNKHNEPAIAALVDGGFIIFYGKDKSASQIRGQRLDSVGCRVGGDFLVAHENGAKLSAVGLDDGRAAVCYSTRPGTVKTAILGTDTSAAITRSGDGETAVLEQA